MSVDLYTTDNGQSFEMDSRGFIKPSHPTQFRLWPGDQVIDEDGNVIFTVPAPLTRSP